MNSECAKMANSRAQRMPTLLHRLMSKLRSAGLRRPATSKKRTSQRGAVSSRTLVLSVPPLFAASSAMAKNPQDVLDRLFHELAASQPKYAMAAAMAFGDQAPHVLVSGNQSLDSDIQVGLSQAWHIGSITKSFTATLIMRLSEHGVLDLDAAISGYLEPYTAGMHVDWQSLTLRQLLRHTGGLPANASILSFLHRDVDDATAARIKALQRLWRKPIGSHDGSYEYSNIGYVLAGLVAEQVTGQPWKELIQNEIAGPLNLETLGFGPPTGPDAPWGHGSFLGFPYSIDPKNPGADNPDWMGPAGLMHLSMSDLVRWGQAHLRACAGQQPDFLSPESCVAMRTPGEGDYGLGWIVQSLPGADATVVWHNGSNAKWYAILAMVPEHEFAVAIALNRYDAPAVDAFLRDLIKSVVEETG